MRKLKSANKRKWIVGGTAFFLGVMVLSTGFATWIIGINVASVDNGGTNAIVDGTKSNNFELKVDFTTDNSIIVTEKTSSDSPAKKGNFTFENNGYKIGEEYKGTDFDVSGTITLTIGNNSDYYGKSMEIVPSFNYSNQDGTIDVVDENNGTDNNKIDNYVGTSWRNAGNYEYLGLCDPIEVPTETSGNWTVTDDGTNKVYKFVGEITLFKWGSYFNSLKPSGFYTRTTDPDFVVDGEASTEIAAEMNKMETALNGKNIHVILTAQAKEGN